METNTTLSDTALQIAFAGATRLRGYHYQKLFAYFGSDDEILQATPDDLIRAGLSQKVAAAFTLKRRGDFSKERASMTSEHILYIGWNDDRYPSLLRQINDPPLGIFVRGDLHVLSAPRVVAVVGTRTMSAYGEIATALLTAPLAKCGVVIVSGLAFGVDATAHRATLDTCGKTVAVLGSGLDHESVGPRSHLGLAEQIIANGGALVSEYSPGTTSDKFHFPERNRIIAGLSHGVVVVEAKERSGALITARLSMEYNRDVFAVPGPITSQNSAGTNRLIKDGATPLTSIIDLLEFYGLISVMPSAGSSPLCTDDEKRVLTAIGHGATTLESLAAHTRKTPQQLFSLLASLELAGKIKKDGVEITLAI